MNADLFFKIVKKYFPLLVTLTFVMVSDILSVILDYPKINIYLIFIIILLSDIQFGER